MSTQTLTPPAAGQTALTNTPRRACHFAASALQFADVANPPSDRPAPKKISMLARTSAPISHWFWGQIIHDMSGFKPPSGPVVLDYCHDDENLIGHADKFTITPDGLQVEGLLVPFTADDCASEIIYRQSQGTPYESSIDFTGPMRVEYIPEGVTAEVNGIQFGAGYVVREWTIQAVAVCPHGADGDTQAAVEMSRESPTIPVQVFNSTRPGINHMTKTKLTDGEPTEEEKKAEADKKAADEKAAKDKELSDEKAKKDAESMSAARVEVQRFTARFGAEAAAKHFAAGTSYAAALEIEFDALKADSAAKLAAAEKRYSELETKFKAVNRGEKDPLTFSDPTGTPPPTGKASPIGDNLSKFAASLKLPSRN